MPSSPIETKGLRKLVDKYTDQVIEAKVKGCYARATIRLTANYDFETDRYSSLGIGVKGAVAATLPVKVGVDADLKIQTERGGDGNLVILYEVSSHIPPVEVRRVEP